MMGIYMCIKCKTFYSEGDGAYKGFTCKTCVNKSYGIKDEVK